MRNLLLGAAAIIVACVLNGCGQTESEQKLVVTDATVSANLATANEQREESKVQLQTALKDAEALSAKLTKENGELAAKMRQGAEANIQLQAELRDANDALEAHLLFSERDALEAVKALDMCQAALTKCKAKNKKEGDD